MSLCAPASPVNVRPKPAAASDAPRQSKTKASASFLKKRSKKTFLVGAAAGLGD
jgi:hypothetical protein